MAAMFTPMQETISAQSGTGIVISEFRFAGPSGVSDEFIELFNASSSPIDVTGWTIRASNNVNPPSVSVRLTIGGPTLPLKQTIINPGCYFLAANTGFSGAATVAPDATYSIGIADDGGIAVFPSTGTIAADQVGFVNLGSGAAFGAYFEGTRIGVTTPLPAQNRSWERRPNGAFVYQDTNNNAADFQSISPSRPQNKLSACGVIAKYPHEIQGSGATSPLPLGTSVNVRGVVTALTSDGFFLQTESASEDANANTSEGLFVSYTGAVQVGHVVIVTGKVNEFVPAADPLSASRTEVNTVTSVTDLGAGTLPAARLLTNVELSATGSLAQLERFEGMRVTAQFLTAVSGTDSNGAFYSVLTGEPRPFREPGVQVGNPVLPCALAPCNVPVFDGNPERLRVDSDGLAGHAQTLVSTGAVMNNVTGPLDFAARDYTLLPESLAPVGGMSVVGTAAAGANQFTVASLNLGQFYAARLAKASLAIRTVLNSPDVVGVQGVDTYGALADLATQLNADAGAALYEAYPLGNAGDPLGVGFLLKSGRATATGHDVVGADVNDRPSLALHAHVQGPTTSLPQDVTVVVNQLQSLLNVELNDATGANVRAKRQVQAESLATYLQGRQSNNPNEAVISLGDYNAFDFNDGYVDVVGTVRGVPAPADQVALASPSLVSPPFVDVDAANPGAERYSSLSNGNAQSLDHVLVSGSMMGQFVGLVHGRFNVDFPRAFRNDAATPVQLSDRDPLVAYFTFPPDVEAPVFDAVENVVAEATSANGAVVNFTTPSAHDNLDAQVNVSCSPATGSAFAFGNTGVTCSAQDVAGNQSSVSFTVTVQDSTAPALSTPGDQVVEATSTNGATSSFDVTATDAVTLSLNAVCVPSSGSTFVLGTTQVNCSAQDAAGNSGSASFNVTVQDTTAPVVSAPADQVAEATSSAGAVVSYPDATATDTVTSSLSVVCLPSSGSTFALGTTVVNCSTQDGSGNSASASFNVTVRDTVAPVVTVPANKVAEATSGAGAVLTFTATATDAVTSPLNVACSPSSGSTFALGTTTVNCSTQDAAGNSGSASFTVTVGDTTAPVLSLPSNITAEATSASGRVVTFSASATDAVTASPAVTCTPASGSTFAVGTTQVNCSAVDAAGNNATGAFTVTITTQPPPTSLTGHMWGDGDVGSGNRRLTFAFNVTNVTGVDPGSVALTFRDGPGGGDRFSSTRIDELKFSSSHGGAADTVVIKGIGNWNGVAGYRFEACAKDRGTPGRLADTFDAIVYAPNGAVVATASGNLRNGDILTDAEVFTFTAVRGKIAARLQQR